MSLTNQLAVPSPIASGVPLTPLRVAVVHGRRGPMKSVSTGFTETDAPVSMTMGIQSSWWEQYTETVAVTAFPVIKATYKRAWRLVLPCDCFFRITGLSNIATCLIFLSALIGLIDLAKASIYATSRL
jgi:hypothetical protein